MTNAKLLDQADQCRHRAHSYLGRPEATFLLRVAREFERLACERRMLPFDASWEQTGERNAEAGQIRP